MRRFYSVIFIFVLSAGSLTAATTALWLFDEQEGLYPSCPLSDANEDGLHLILGRGGSMVPGKFGRALWATEPEDWSPVFKDSSAEGLVRFGLQAPEMIPGRTVEPLTWFNNKFAAFFTSGNKQLRRLEFANATESALNLGGSDWTVEFWLKLDKGATGEGVIFEIGSGPRGENDRVTRLSLVPEENQLRFVNQSGSVSLQLISNTDLGSDWNHFALTYDGTMLVWFLNGREVASGNAQLKPLPPGDEAYFSVARDGLWKRPLQGAIDELRFSDSVDYSRSFSPPDSFSRVYVSGRKPYALTSGPKLLFPNNEASSSTIDMGSRKHLFLDDVLLAKSDNIELTPHPARLEEIVLEEGTGWSTVIEDENGLIRLYGEGAGGVGVWTSKDGLHFEAPDLGTGRGNQVIPGPARRGSVFMDPNGPPEERWKALVGLHDRGGWYIWTSPDGWSFKRSETAAVPFWPGSASTIFYDDQRQVYVAHHRSDYGSTPGGQTERFFVRTEVTDLFGSWPFEPTTREKALRVHSERPIQVNQLDPWWLDNGPLAPPGFGIEFPIVMGRDPEIDPVATDIYNTRAIKYPWAEDAYVAFPLWFFHYHGDGPETRQILAHPDRKLGTGMVEPQLAVSRDGVNWKRYPRPAYIPLGDHRGFPVKRPYIAFGMVRRGNEIFQYSYTRASYHDAWTKDAPPPVTHRLTQRLDGFVSLRSPYTGGSFTTRPFRFSGSRLNLNIDTGVTGFAQVGLLDQNGNAIPGFSVKDCIYINTNDVEHTVEWLDQGADVSSLSGKTIQLVVHMRGTDLYAFQFNDI